MLNINYNNRRDGTSRYPVRPNASKQLPSLDDWRASLARDSLPDFIKQAWHLVEPSRPLVWNWHLDILCDAWQRSMRGDPEYQRVVVNIPPGTSKSSLVSVFGPAHEWIAHPDKRFILASYTIDNPIRDNRKLRTIVESQWYEDRFWNSYNGNGDERGTRQVRLAADQSAKLRFDNTERGWRIATSVDGIMTGEHGHVIVIDDPTKAKASITELEACNSWMDNTVSTRVALNPAIWVVMQRLHLKDLSEHLKGKGGWKFIVFPMRYRPTQHDEHGKLIWQADPLDKRTVPGELLWPELWSEEKVAQEELGLGQFGASSQLGQSPVPAGGALYKRDWFEIVDSASVPINCIECRGWDTAETDAEEDSAKTANWTVGTKLALAPDGTIYVRHNVRDQVTNANPLIKNTAISDGPGCRIREGSGSGKATIKARTIMLAGYDYAASPETRREGDKIERNAPFRAQAQARNVKVVRGEWNEVWLDTICSFPFGTCDDDVDSTSNAYNELVNAMKYRSATWGSRSHR